MWQPALAKGLTGGLSVYLKSTQWLCHDPVNLVLDNNIHYPTKRYLDAEDSVALVLLLVLVQVLVLVQRADGGVAGEGGDGDGVGVQGRGVVAEEAVDREGAADPEGRPADLRGSQSANLSSRVGFLTCSQEWMMKSVSSLFVILCKITGQ